MVESKPAKRHSRLEAVFTGVGIGAALYTTGILVSILGTMRVDRSLYLTHSKI